jgi:hypothetical protein
MRFQKAQVKRTDVIDRTGKTDADALQGVG